MFKYFVHYLSSSCKIALPPTHFQVTPLHSFLIILSVIPQSTCTLLHMPFASPKPIDFSLQVFASFLISLGFRIGLSNLIGTPCLYTGFLQTKNRLQNLSSHIQKLTNQQPTYLYNSRFIVTFCTRSSDSLVLSHSICLIITWQKGFLCHRSTPLEFTPPWYPKLIFSTNIPFQTQNDLFKIAQALSHLPGLSTRILILAILILCPIEWRQC